MAKDKGESPSVPDFVGQRDNTFFTEGPSDPRSYAGKQGVDKGPVPLSHWGPGANFDKASNQIGRSRTGIGMRPEAQNRKEK